MVGENETQRGSACCSVDNHCLMNFYEKKKSMLCITMAITKKNFCVVSIFLYDL